MLNEHIVDRPTAPKLRTMTSGVDLPSLGMLNKMTATKPEPVITMSANSITPSVTTTPFGLGVWSVGFAVVDISLFGCNDCVDFAK